MSKQWWVFVGDQVQGPYSPLQLSGLARSGQLDPTTLVRSSDGSDWVAASTIKGLFAGPRASAPPPTPPQSALTPQIVTAPPPLPTAAAGKANPAMYAVLGGGATLAVLLVIGGIVYMVNGGDDAPAENTTSVAHSTPEPSSTATAGGASVSGEQGSTGNADAARVAAAVDGTNANAAPTRNASTVDANEVAAAPASTTPADGTPTPDTPDTPDEPSSDAELARVNAEPEPSAEPPQMRTSPPVQDAGPTAAPVVTRPAMAARPVLRPKPLVPIVLPERTTIADGAITEFNRRVQLQATADDAYSLYLRFAQSYDFTGEQQERVDGQLMVWKERAEAGLARLGATWVSPDEVVAAREQAQSHINRAEVLVKAGDYKSAIELLEEASRVDLNGVRADYILGLLYSLPQLGRFGAEYAEKHFDAVLRRSPDDAAAMNSLAITLIKQHEHSRAFKLLEKAANLSPECPEITQNLGRFGYLVNSDRINSASRGLYKQFETLYTDLMTAGKGREFNPETGWLHIIPLFPEGELNGEVAAVSTSSSDLNQLRMIATGTGVVVAPEYVLTNRHVVEASRQLGATEDYGIADEVRVALASDAAGKEMVGAVVAIADETDLALIHIPGLKGPAMFWGDEPPAVDSDLMVLGFPRETLLGNGLRADTAQLTALPDANREAAGDYLLLQCAVEHAHTGGPVMTRGGNAAGIVTLQFNTGAAGSGAIPASVIRGFLASNIPDWTNWDASRPKDDAPGDWTTVVQRATPAVLRVKCFYEAGESTIAVAQKDADLDRNTYEDYTCPQCSGLSWLPCPKRGCANGEVTERYFTTVTTQAGPIRSSAQVPQTRRVRCPTCLGQDRLDCPSCINGYDVVLLKDYAARMQQQPNQFGTLPGGGGGGVPMVPGGGGAPMLPGGGATPAFPGGGGAPTFPGQGQPMNQTPPQSRPGTK
ncbi:MAG: trypsin-like peptidase domain-containing protein [Planctomycetaceae bacterium]